MSLMQEVRPWRGTAVTFWWQRRRAWRFLMVNPASGKSILEHFQVRLLSAEGRVCQLEGCVLFLG